MTEKGTCMEIIRQIARCTRLLLVLGAALGTAGTAAGQSESRDARFEKEIVPILKQHCVQCHGAKLTRGGLDLSTAAGLVTGSDSGPVIVKGSADKSMLFEKIADQTMPPPEKKDRLSDKEIATLRKWLDDGAPGTETTGPLTKDKKDSVTEEDRAHWAFRKAVAGAVPPVQTTGRVRTPVDAFVLAKLESKGLAFSPDAEKTTLLRRAYLDLVGLPPSREEVQAFLADTSADAYERVVDRLLDSVHYGERWGRHWLDVAGYTDSPHCDKQGAFLPAEDWRYRDYVVRSFNDDKPYDRFLIEQLAGDEFVDWRSATRFTPEILDALIATGYLRTTPDWTHSDVFQEAYRYDTLARVVDNVSTGVLGLTMNCARCHSHKYEPIPHEDYYRLMAVFATAYNTEDWLRPEQRFLADIPPAGRAEIDEHNKKIETRLEQIKKELDAVRAPHKKEVIAGRLAMLPEAIRADVETALNTALESRNEIQRYLASKFDSLTMVTDQQIKFTEAETASLTKLGNEFGSLQGQKKSYGKLQSLFDVGKPPALPQLIRGDSRTPGKVVEAGFPSVLCPPDNASALRRPETPADSSGRRLALARWLTS
ncbi:MAG: DUF1549 domain-containing protein, partial [Planctomycetia bacterium]|nr:DUF1549 domain-containing protein [Planctomycetia bacterium]